MSHKMPPYKRKSSGTEVGSGALLGRTFVPFEILYMLYDSAVEFQLYCAPNRHSRFQQTSRLTWLKPC